MSLCAECRGSEQRTLILPEHVEDLGGITVRLLNAVRLYTCDSCGAEETEIPDLRGLVRTVAVARALLPLQLSGNDIRFMRRALDMTQVEFAQAMELTQETVSRWENDVRGAGGATEKLLRHNVCALLHGHVPAVDYEPATITRMRIVQHDPESMPPLPLMVMERVVLKRDHRRDDAWDYLPAAA